MNAADVIRANNTAPRLLKKLADTLNVMETCGIRVQLAHDTVLTNHGYVMSIGAPGKDVKWQVRTRRLTEFAAGQLVNDVTFDEEDA